MLTGKFKKGLKLAKKRGLDIKLLEDIVDKLQNGIPLEEKHRDHELKGKFKGFRECHIQLVQHCINNDELNFCQVYKYCYDNSM